MTLARQPDGDLGARMLAALEAADGPALVIGTDCPAHDAGASAHGGRGAAQRRRRGGAPAEDGGYVLIGLRKPLPALFAGMEWGTARSWRKRGGACASIGSPGTSPPLWDVDVPEDLPRLRGFGACWTNSPPR